MRIFRSMAMAVFAVMAVLKADAGIVSGVVTDESGTPIPGTAVSDGVNVVLTDSEGRYAIDTGKRNGYVFVTVPSGYAPVKSQGNRPQFWHQLTAPRQQDERADFMLRRIDDSRHVLLALADIQLSKRNDDVRHFNEVILPDINATIGEYRKQGMDVMVLTLGDESFDKFWYKNKYALPEVCADMEKIDCPVYNVIGNHDHDPYVAGDHGASRAWRRLMGPNYYSFNRGAVHYVILDDVHYINEGASLGHVGKRNNEAYITPEQLEWLRQDLSYVTDPATPIVVAMHIPLLHQDNASGELPDFRLKNAKRLMSLLAGYDHVQFLSGHTHRNSASMACGGRVRENTYGAVCGTLWYWNTPEDGPNGSLCTDGSPAGYGVWEVDGRNLRGHYKGYGHGHDYQFRAYDLNQVLIPNEKYASDYSRKRNDNEILVNVWGYAPGWTVGMSENGVQLDVERVYCQDPLYLVLNGIPLIQAGTKGYRFPRKSSHMFKAKASSADAPVTITVTDLWGRSYTQVMERPKAFVPEMK